VSAASIEAASEIRLIAITRKAIRVRSGTGLTAAWFATNSSTSKQKTVDRENDTLCPVHRREKPNWSGNLEHNIAVVGCFYRISDPTADLP
jgi:hypothetical protein